MTNSVNTSALDRSALTSLHELIGGDDGALIDLVETFLIEGDELVTALRASEPLQDHKTLKRSAHSLKNSALDFGAIAVAARCAELEAASVNAWPDEAHDQITAIEHLWQQSRTDLTVWLSDYATDARRGSASP